jgi:hypothetical protein
MSIRSRIAAIPRKVLICQVVGFCIFVTAFFLPACHVGGRGTFAENVWGWECAKIAIQATPSLFEKPNPFISFHDTLLTAMSGWINPLILLYVSFCFARKFFRVRRILAMAILVCLAATWIFFAIAHFIPLIGHFLWIAGALLILAPEVPLFKRNTPTDNQQLPLGS